MKDEHGNEAPYDFKNIMSQTTYTTQQLNNYYTFSTLDENDNIIDASLHGKAKNNVIASGYYCLASFVCLEYMLENGMVASLFDNELPSVPL